jgi:hypothetical protein
MRHIGIRAIQNWDTLRLDVRAATGSLAVRAGAARPMTVSGTLDYR